MNIIDENLSIINKNLDDKIHDMIKKLERNLKDTQNEPIQLPSNIIINILQMIPRDSQMKSPTATIIRNHINAIIENDGYDGSQYHASWAYYRWNYLEERVDVLWEQDLDFDEIVQRLNDVDIKIYSPLILRDKPKYELFEFVR